MIRYAGITQFGVLLAAAIIGAAVINSKSKRDVK